MALFAEFDAASQELVLGPTLEALPSLEVELERQYAVDPSRPIAFCWMRCAGGDRNRVERTLADDDTVAEFQRIADAHDGALYRIRRSGSGVVGAYRRWVALGGELLECRGSSGRWRIEMRFPDRGAFTRYHAFLEGEGVEIALHRLSEDDAPSDDDLLTDSQYEALEIAFESGFFEVPREADLSAIANELEISNQAVSERLRRAQSSLVAEHVVSGGRQTR
ncbi:bacterio-opsin activator [Halobiforma lacisalsi AJ5]|uniref:Bacterio-opsin activator n=1 Tax=Natronobacterium lacisalsi AJ5 TaxID=358396 RepID=M0L4X2_NATLA|nr:helix-turn-helix domain-containing protein [Halobiforma lacisalsi]APW98050.1 bacterio-opsin activator [Halobiforma lacisalsi AJ5]EMA28606.1 Bacterio-opsin activator HTH domain protein [Halobiforma lacisalsi AJ5]